MQAYESFCDRWSLTPFGDGLEFHSETDYEERDAALDHKIKI